MVLYRPQTAFAAIPFLNLRTAKPVAQDIKVLLAERFKLVVISHIHSRLLQKPPSAQPNSLRAESHFRVLNPDSLSIEYPIALIAMRKLAQSFSAGRTPDADRLLKHRQQEMPPSSCLMTAAENSVQQSKPQPSAPLYQSCSLTSVELPASLSILANASGSWVPPSRPR